MMEIDFSPWNQRAWCFQERLLSKRLVHFAESQLYFETIVAGVESDNFLGKKIVGQCDPTSIFTGKEALNAITATSEDETANAVPGFSERAWTEYISNYTRRHLTFGFRQAHGSIECGEIHARFVWPESSSRIFCRPMD
jgi:hypothetical protein